MNNDKEELENRIEKSIIKKQEFRNELNLVNLRIYFLQNKISYLNFDFDIDKFEKHTDNLKDLLEEKEYLIIKINKLKDFIKKDKKTFQTLLFKSVNSYE